MTTWKFTDSTNTVVFAAFEDGHTESHLVTADVIQAWIKAGNTPLPYEPPAVDPKEQAKVDLAASDKDLARVAEDLIDVLKTKGVITDSDLPQAVRDKLAMRKGLRAQLR